MNARLSSLEQHALPGFESVLLIDSFPILFWSSCSFVFSLSTSSLWSFHNWDQTPARLFSLNNNAIALQEDFIVKCHQYSGSVLLETRFRLWHLGSDAVPILLLQLCLEPKVGLQTVGSLACWPKIEIKKALERTELTAAIQLVCAAAGSLLGWGSSKLGGTSSLKSLSSLNLNYAVFEEMKKTETEKVLYINKMNGSSPVNLCLGGSMVWLCQYSPPRLSPKFSSRQDLDFYCHGYNN